MSYMASLLGLID